jgi:hypothetical protein
MHAERLFEVLLQIFEVSCHHVPVLLGAREHHRALDDGYHITRQPTGVQEPPWAILYRGGCQEWPTFCVRLLRDSHLARFGRIDRS